MPILSNGVDAKENKMAKFKVGDKVRSKTQKNLGVLRVRGVQEGEPLYDLESTDGSKWARVKGRLIESDLVLANAVGSANAVVANALAANAVARNGRYDDPQTHKSCGSLVQALKLMERARLEIGLSNEDEAPYYARQIDTAIGQVKKCISDMK